MTVFAGVLGYESFWLGAEGWVAVCSNVIPRWSARAVRAGRRQARHGRSARALQQDDAAAVVGRRPALRLGHQGLPSR